MTGTELKAHRHIGSILAKNILNSSVKFINKNILESDYKEKFDVVLLLNVIHHLPEPFYAIRKLSEMAKEVFVLEFPTLDDPNSNLR